MGNHTILDYLLKMNKRPNFIKDRFFYETLAGILWCPAYKYLIF